MLSVTQVKRMSKPYTDKQIVGRGSRHIGGDEFWANGEIALFEPKPDRLTNQIAAASEDNARTVAGINDQATRKVYPVELNGDEDDTFVRFSDGGGADLWVNGGYAAALVKRGATDFYTTADSIALAARNGRDIGFVMACALDFAKYHPIWHLRNTDLSDARRLTWANRIAHQVAKRGKTWHTVFVAGTVARARIVKEHKREWLELSMAGHSFKVALDNGELAV